jgi:hypothetical protein
MITLTMKAVRKPITGRQKMDIKSLVEHLPFVMATGIGPQLDLKDLIGAVLVGGISAVGSSYITTKEIVVEVRVLTKQQEQLAGKLDSAISAHNIINERVTRLETVESTRRKGNGM